MADDSQAVESFWPGFVTLAVARHSKRAFLDRPVPRAVLEDVLAVAAHAPSTRNSQPWRVAVVTGAARDALARRLRAEFDRGVAPHPDYANQPAVPDRATRERARAFGAGLFGRLGIARDDAQARRANLRGNLDFHGAPVTLIFHLPADAVPGTFLELGFFLQNTMLGLVARGLASCPQYSVAGYPDVLREALGLGDRLIVCGLATGYPDPAAGVNGYAPERAPLRDYVTWHDQPPT